MNKENKPFLLISGASGSIGQQITLRLAKEYNLIVMGKNKERLDSLSLKLGQSQVITIECDLTRIDSIIPTLQEHLQTNPNLSTQEAIPLQGFIHCAGISYIGYAKTFNYENMIEVANVNLFSCMEIVKYLIKKHKQSLKSLVFISSAFSKKGEVGNSFYAATKGGLDSYMKSLALELAPNIRANTIQCGGIFNTNMTNIFTQGQKERILKLYPLGEGEARDIANAVAFLMSMESRWISGTCLQVDGGFHI